MLIRKFPGLDTNESVTVLLKIVDAFDYFVHCS